MGWAGVFYRKRNTVSKYPETIRIWLGMLESSQKVEWWEDIPEVPELYKIKLVNVDGEVLVRNDRGTIREWRAK